VYPVTGKSAFPVKIFTFFSSERKKDEQDKIKKKKKKDKMERVRTPQQSTQNS
jgi:hypothetical protein